MNFRVFKILGLVIISLSLLGCYTQMKFVDRSDEAMQEVYIDEEYYYSQDSLYPEGTIVNNYYFGISPSYYDSWYDPWYDPWYWRPTPRWGVYIGFNSFWGWGYPWGWYGPCCYPYVSPYAYGWHGSYSYWNPYYYPPNYYYSGKKYAKRSFDRRQPGTPRSIAKGNGRGSNPADKGGGGSASGIGRTSGDMTTASGIRTTGTNGSRIVRTNLDGKRQIARSSSEGNIRGQNSSARTSSRRTSVTNRQPGAKERQSTYKPRRSTSGSRKGTGSSSVKRGSSNRRGSTSYRPSSGSSGSRSSSGRSSGSRSSSSGSRSSSSSNSGSRSSSKR